MIHHKPLIFCALAVLLTAGIAWGQDDVGADFCAECHEDVVTAFAAGPHGQAMKRQSDDTFAKSCATCHGPVEQHLEEFSAESIHFPGPKACESCHLGAGAGLERSMPDHPRRGIACLDCHVSGHGDVGAEPLLAAETQTLCGGCHTEQKSAFNRPFAHRDGQKPVGCETCHDPHGDGRQAKLSLLGSGGACVGCHGDLAGPFIFPHPPREVDGCVTCHEPHGSVNPRQLVRRTVFNLCLECHTTLPQGQIHDFSTPRGRACQTCHRAVHGSNIDPRFFDE